MLRHCGRSLLLLAPVSFRYMAPFHHYHHYWYGTQCHTAVLAGLIVVGVTHEEQGQGGERDSTRGLLIKPLYNTCTLPVLSSGNL